jgi:hypothetical protein
VRQLSWALLTVVQLALEKQLWLLTGFQMQSTSKVRVTPKLACDTGRILELYGNLCESNLYNTVTMLCKI